MPKFKFPRVPLRFDPQNNPSATGVILHVMSEADGKKVGIIKWYKNFELYLFQADARKVLNDTCHKMIGEMLKQLNKSKPE